MCCLWLTSASIALGPCMTLARELHGAGVVNTQSPPTMPTHQDQPPLPSIIIDMQPAQGAATAEQVSGPAAPIDVSEIPAPFRPGEILENGFELTRMLGMGGMGGVVLAVDKRLDRQVAIKFIRPSLMPSPSARQQFVREARAMARVRHENVVTIFAAGAVEGAPYFVMEYVPGTTLARLCQQRDSLPFPIDEAMRILRNVALAVASIHEAGTFHLDLKPSNVLIGSKFRVAVTDFGLARTLDQSRGDDDAVEDQTKRLFGSPGYLSPELILGQAGTAASDVYSLSVMAYRLFTGRKPFTGETTRDILYKHVNTTPTHPSELTPYLPHALGDAILAGLAKRPEARPKSVLEWYYNVSREATDASGDKPMRIVIADDDDDMRVLVQEIIHAEFPAADVEAVADGRQAFTSLLRKPASLVVIDLRMPEMDGFQLTKAIRSTESINRTPIIVMTAQGGAPEWRVLFSLGANSFIAKPFMPSDIVLAIRRFLGQAESPAQ